MRCNLRDMVFSRRDKMKSHLKSLDFHGLVFAPEKRGRPSAYHRPGPSSRVSLSLVALLLLADHLLVVVITTVEVIVLRIVIASVRDLNHK